MARRLRYLPHPIAPVGHLHAVLVQLLEVRETDTVLEIGIGNGCALYQLAQWAANIHGLDIAPAAVHRVQAAVATAKAPQNRIEVWVQDFCEPDLVLQHQYDLVVSCDTLEHVREPRPFLRNAYQAMKPGGRLFATFPNEHPDAAHGALHARTIDELQMLLADTGFRSEDVRISVLRMTEPAETLFDMLWTWPLRAVRRVRGRRLVAAPLAVDSFDETEFAQLSARLETVAPFVNGYLWTVMAILTRLGEVYTRTDPPPCLWDTRILIEATRERAMEE